MTLTIHRDLPRLSHDEVSRDFRGDSLRLYHVSMH